MSTIQRGSTTAGTLLLLAALGGCSGDGPVGFQPGSVEGQVTASGAGVQGVTVSVDGGGAATTDGAGIYRINNVAPGTNTVVITLPAGWITATFAEPLQKTVDVPPGGSASAGWMLKPGVVVTASGTSFSPANVSIPAGHTVRWVSTETTHTVTPDDPAQPGAWTGTALGAGGFEHTFLLPDTYPYHCIPHQSMGMVGSVTVQP
jgi:plastocyanin